MLALIGWAVLLWFGVTGCYVLVVHAKVLRDSGRLNLFWKVNVLPWAVIGLLLDVAFNATAGTLCFAELPRELLFTKRVQRHVNESDSWRLRLALWWMRQLNQIEADHVHAR